MKRGYFFLMLLTLSLFAHAQKYDYNWLLAEGKLSADTFYGSLLVDFSNLKLPKFTPVSQPEYGQSKLSMSDKDGNFLFYSTGARVFDSKYSIIENGDTINAGYVRNTEFTKQIGYPFVNGIISIPGFDDQSFLVIYCHLGVNTDMTELIPNLKFSKVCLNQDKLVVSIKDTPVISDTINRTGMNLCKHANGRDWWLLKPDRSNRSFYKVLINKDGFKIVDKQQVDTTSMFSNGLGQSVFSPDGTVLACLDEVNGLRIFDFDRCSGNITLRELIPNYKEFEFSGVAISPNNKFLYVSLTHDIIQHDLASNNIFLSADTVARWDSTLYQNFWENNFSSMQLAPDGKIYVTTTSSSKTFHAIDYPDLRGKDCQVRKFAVRTTHFRGLPQYPNYRLGSLTGSPCDTLSVATKDLPPTDYGLKVFPNPASDRIQIDITLPHYDPSTKTEVVVVDLSGEIVQKYTMPDYAYLATLDISKLASGVYRVQLRQLNRVLAVEKLVVVR